ncbi:hypothetical protein ACFPPA_05715 [Rhodanobacter ginsengisoli]|uniref:Uncharacterized protein n=1 Tax=Rhodanobacter ginsengisoli TaxID=418646 RepID=A0ABW0QKV5_9GAMM
MKLMHLLAAALLFAPIAVFAEGLKPDAVVCETESALAMLAQPNLAGEPGSVVMKRIDATIKFEQLAHQANGMLGNMAAQEEAIRNGYGASGSSQVQASQAAAAQQEAQTKGQQAQAFQRQCMATGAQAVTVSVLERRPISGAVKVSMLINGSQAEVWTVASYLE